ncbi:MAG: SIS domain-containing protein [Candidatus Marinimicrobia bacterium]|nr:SIS domain-containing protein [Candidatus Neomarinimicrobiota bacterium]
MEALDTIFTRRPELAACRPAAQAAAKLLRQCFGHGGKLLVCGNGGSAADSEHIVGELMKGFCQPRPVPSDIRRKLVAAWPEDGLALAAQLQGALPAISLVSQSALLTAFANDVSPDLIFAQQVYGYGRPGDVLWAISTSGNSKNVIQAARVGRALGLGVLGFTGPEGGALASLCDVVLCVPGADCAEIQEGHQVLYHALCAQLEAVFFRVAG